VKAGTLVCEPIVRVRAEVPAASVGAVLPALARHHPGLRTPTLRGSRAEIETVLPAARVHVVQRELPVLTGGEGVMETEFAGYEPVAGKPPVRHGATPLARRLAARR
jgi:ribosomal protection tetracycline resistance protein